MGLLIGLIGWLSKLHAHFEPDVVAFECLLRVDLRQPFQFGCDTGFAQLRDVRERRSNACRHFLEVPQPRTVAAVAGSLLQVEIAPIPIKPLPSGRCSATVASM